MYMSIYEFIYCHRVGTCRCIKISSSKLTRYDDISKRVGQHRVSLSIYIIYIYIFRCPQTHFCVHIFIISHLQTEFRQNVRMSTYAVAGYNIGLQIPT